MDDPIRRLLAVIRSELPEGTAKTVESFLTAYWKLSDQQTDWTNRTGVALNNLAERLEYFEPTEAQAFDGAVNLGMARGLIDEVLSISASESL